MRKLRQRPRARSSQGEACPVAGMRQVTPHAAGVDMGAHEIGACGPDGDDQQRVRTCGTYTAARQTLADWGVDRGLQTVAMASTGVSGISRCEALAARSLQGCLRSAQAIQRVPGRKRDGLDCQWLQPLHSDGFVSAL